MKILMVEDNREVSEMMSMFFSKEKWDVEYAYDGEEAVNKFKSDPESWDMITLDLNLPKKDGMQVNAEIRKISSTVPIIILTARNSESDQTLGLEMGADDYVAKPFSPMILIARIKALHRRALLQGIQTEETTGKEYDIETKHLMLSTSTRKVLIDGTEIEELTPKEFELLKALASKPRQVYSRDQLLQMVWGYEFYGDERTVDAHIKKLRQKIETVGPQIIKTVWGVGYKFDDTEVEK
ncbi:response regulator transcription factor [Ligilactobacillus hayakitensis]|nr:response regulator transcription factor [Ligilactobacillus hayakitensis]